MHKTKTKKTNLASLFISFCLFISILKENSIDQQILTGIYINEKKDHRPGEICSGKHAFDQF